MKSETNLWKWFLPILTVLAMSERLMAQQVTQQEAVNAAVNTLLMEYADRITDFTDTSIVSVFTLDRNGHTLIYEVCFNSGDRVFLSGCKSCLPILGHITRIVQFGQERTTLSEDEEIPDGLKQLLQDYSYQVEQSLNQPTPSKYNALWDSLQFKRANISWRSVVIPPLIATRWGQDKSNDSVDYDYYAYNILMDSGYHCQFHCSAGCGPVAMAQILKYWSYPLEIPFRCIPYFWMNMPNKLIKNNNTQYVIQRHLVSSLLLGCGTDIQTIYCNPTDSLHPCSSSTNIWNVKNGFRKYGYVNSDILYRGSNSSAWMESLYQELYNNRPVYYAATSTDHGGHAFVCDGYFKDQNNNQYFHFNWGWNGDCDGLFSVDNLNPGINYAYNHRIIYQIQPTTCFQDIIMECGKTFHNESKTYRAVEQFKNDGYEYVIESGSLVFLQAGNEILLTDGFYAAQGSEFQASIVPCSSTLNSMSDNLIKNGNDSIPSDTLPAPKSLQIADSGTYADAALRVYPNPTDDVLFIELRGGAGIANMALYDLQGRVVGTRFIASATGASATGASATVNMRDIPTGVYILRVTDADGKEYHRKIVRK